MTVRFGAFSATRRSAAAHAGQNYAKLAPTEAREKTSSDLQGVVPPVTEPSRAVFLSYASQDAEAAQRICEVLQAAGVEVWFDQSELRGGDAWDQSIRNQIKTCALFLPVISRNTHDRTEGYFRLEWKLAVDRSHLITAHRAFLLPVVIDETTDDEEHVPDKFREVQWTRLPAGEASRTFVEHVQRLLSGEAGHSPTMTQRSQTASGRPSRFGPWLALTAVVVAGAVAYLLIEKPWAAKPVPTAKPAEPPQNPVVFTPPLHSIAVLPFVNMSGDKEQEYFSDGLTEELINALSHIDTLEVAARTSSFSFRGQGIDIATIARKLNVGAILEGSVRRSGHRVRITTQLINATNGFHLWSENYDRDLKDLLGLQADVATAVAIQLQARLLGDEASRIAAGGTRNPGAYEAYMRGVHLQNSNDMTTEGAWRAALVEFDRAISLDPRFAAAYSRRAAVQITIALVTDDLTVRETMRKAARQSAERAIELAPDLAEAHANLGEVLEAGAFEDADPMPEFEQALALAPGEARVQGLYGTRQASLGHAEPALAAFHRAIHLDPRNFRYRSWYIWNLYLLRRYDEALAEIPEAKILRPQTREFDGLGWEIDLARHQPELARQKCEPDESNEHECLALAYHALGKLDDAQKEFEKLKAETRPESNAVTIARVYAQWGDRTSSLRWLATAERVHSPGLEYLSGWQWELIRSEPEFQGLLRRLYLAP
jgi:TolB-like protein